MAYNELSTWATPGTYSFTIPPWAQFIDRVAVGGGRAGSGYVFGRTANGGKAGLFAWDTLTAGVDFTPGDTITVVTGAGGASNGAVGSASTITVGSNVLTGAAGPNDAYISGYPGQPVNTGNTNSNNDVLLNGLTYDGGTGGTGTSSNNAAGAPIFPGGGGWGSNSNGINGRPGGNGCVWLNVRTNAVTFDSSQSVSVSLTAGLARTATLQAATPVSVWGSWPVGFPMEDMSRGQSIGANLGVGVSTNSTNRYGGSMNSNLFVNASLLAAGVNTLRAAATLAVVCGLSASATEFGTAAATLAVLASISAAAQRTANVVGSTAVAVSSSAAGSCGQMVDVDTVVSAGFPAGVRYDSAGVANLVVNTVILGAASRAAPISAGSAVTVGFPASVIRGPAVGVSTAVLVSLSATAALNKTLNAATAVGVTTGSAVSAAFEIGSELAVVFTPHAGYGGFREILLVPAQDRRALVRPSSRFVGVLRPDRSVAVPQRDLGVTVPAVSRLADVAGSGRSAAVPEVERLVVVDPDVTEVRVV